jgi:hypothetical protein
MKLDEFQNKAVSNLRRRRGEVVEALPAIAGIARAAGMGARAVSGAVKTVAKAGSQAASAVRSATSGGANSTVGTQGSGAASAQVSGVGSSIAQKATAKAAQEVSQKLLKRGGKIPMPNDKGQTQQYQIDNIKGDEVTITDPKAKNNQGTPSKYIVNKKDVDAVIQGMVSNTK